MDFTDEEFLTFTEELYDIFGVNYIDGPDGGVQCWKWRNEGDAMRACRYAPAPKSNQTLYPDAEGRVPIFSVVVHRHSGADQYVLGFTDHQCLIFDSLESLIAVLVGIVKSLKLATKYLEVA